MKTSYITNMNNDTTLTVPKEAKKVTAIKLYDHEPWVMAWLPFLTLTISGLLLLPAQLKLGWDLHVRPEILFWVNFAAGWYFLLALLTNMRLWGFLVFWCMVGLFLGLPYTIDAFTGGRVFRAIVNAAGASMPQMNAGGYLIAAFGIFGVLLVWDFIWSRMQTRAIVTATEFKILKVGQTERSWELIGLMTSHEPQDYFERAWGGFGTFSIALRSGAVIFEQKRVFRMYRVWWLFWLPGKKVLIDRLIDGTNVTVNDRARQDRIEAIDAIDAAHADDHGHTADEHDHHDLDHHHPDNKEKGEIS